MGITGLPDNIKGGIKKLAERIEEQLLEQQRIHNKREKDFEKTKTFAEQAARKEAEEKNKQTVKELEETKTQLKALR